MAKFDVVVMRPLSLLGKVDGYVTLQDLQYVATGLSAHTMQDAGALAIAEVMAICRNDYPMQPASAYTVLGTLRGEVYRPWFNGNYP